MAKKNKQRKNVALSMRGLAFTTKTSELTPPLSPPISATITGEKPSSYSLPGSPVAKITPSLQPSPTLSATSNNPLRPDFNPFLLPPLKYHSDAQQGLVTIGDWDPVDAQSAKRKSILKSKRQDLIEQDQSNTPEQVNDLVPADSAHTELEEPKPASTSALEPSELKSEAEDQPARQENAEQQPKEHLNSLEIKVVNDLVAQEEGQDHPVESSGVEDTNAVQKPLQTHQYPPPPSGYWPSPVYYGQHLPRLPRNMAYQQGYPYGMPPPRNGSPYQTPYNGFPGPYPPYGGGSPLQRHDSFGSRGSNPGDHGPIPPIPPGDNGSAIEENPAELWARVSSILPDIHALIDQHKSTHEGLSLREQLIRKEKADSAEAVRNKDEYINRLMKQLQEVEKHNASEASKYRLHIGNLEDKRKELEERLLDAELGRKAAQAMNKQLSEEKTSLIEDRKVLTRAAVEEKHRLVKEFEEWKIRAGELLEAEKGRAAEEKVRLLRDLEDLKMAALESQKMVMSKELKQKLKAQGEQYDDQKAKLVEDLTKEKDDLRISFQAQKKEIETSFESMRKDLESKLNSTQADLEKAIKTEREGREQWGAERETLTQSWEQLKASVDKEIEGERQALVKQQEEDMAGLARKHKEDLNEQMMGFVSLQEGINKKMTTENDGLREEIASLKKAWDQDKEKFEGIVKELGGVAQSLDAEKG